MQLPSSYFLLHQQLSAARTKAQNNGLEPGQESQAVPGRFNHIFYIVDCRSAFEQQHYNKQVLAVVLCQMLP